MSAGKISGRVEAHCPHLINAGPEQHNSTDFRKLEKDLRYNVSLQKIQI
jgi:hypothetical protein